MLLFFFHNNSITFQILFELLAKGGSVKELIEKKDLVQVSSNINHYWKF